MVAVRTAALVVLQLQLSIMTVKGSDVYDKPDVSSKECVEVAKQIYERTQQDGYSESCLGCFPAIGQCPVGCQKLVDDLYSACDGVTLPDGLYYDSITGIGGNWDDVKQKVKISAERCGCNHATSVTRQESLAPLFMVIVVALIMQLGI